jgi:hypothetical protein
MKSKLSSPPLEFEESNRRMQLRASTKAESLTWCFFSAIPNGRRQAFGRSVLV